MGLRTIILVLLGMIAIGALACGGGAAPATGPASSAPKTQPDPTSTATPVPTPSRVAVEATAVVVPSLTPAPVGTTEPKSTATLVPTEPSPPPTTASATITPTLAPTSTTVPPTETPTKPPAFAGTFLLLVNQPGGQAYSGKTVTFKIGSLEATETSTWQQGGVEVINLSVSSSYQGSSGSFSERAAAAHTGPNSAAGVLASPAFQPLPPHVFMGTATVDGEPASQGTVITAWVDGVEVPDAVATVEAAPVAASTAGQVKQALASLGDKLLRVWKFDSETQSWTFYDPSPAFANYNTVKELVTGQFYYIVTAGVQSASLNGQNRALFDGWNPLVW